MSLYAGGGQALMVRDVGTASPVQGQQASGSAIHGANLNQSLPTLVLQQSGAGWAQLTQVVPALKKFWVNIMGTPNETLTWIKIAGTWKIATPWIREGSWK